MRKIIQGEKHFTASVWIIAKSSPKKVLLVHHKKYNKWIQPGGHIEQFENPIQAAIREVKEETGLDISFVEEYSEKTEDNVTKFLNIPQYFLEQKISTYKNEPEHFHLDLQYVVEIDEQVIQHNVDESHSIGWFTKEEAVILPTHEDTKLIVRKLLNTG